MLSIDEIFRGRKSFAQLSEVLTIAELRRLTNEMIDAVWELIDECDDTAVTFVPEDPDAYDDAAMDESELHLAWTLGHVIVHITASAEESAAIAAELARGVSYRDGRSRSEVPWTTIETLAQCKHRLEESRRMRLASLDMWPDEPYLDNVYVGRSGHPINAVLRFLLGLRHDYDHLDQIENILAQAREAAGAPI